MSATAATKGKKVKLQMPRLENSASFRRLHASRPIAATFTPGLSGYGVLLQLTSEICLGQLSTV
jgi:hypothetical protein